MLNAMTISEIYVLDQDEALDFYVGVLGLEVRADVDLGFMRWLTVGVPGDGDREILLERPGPPSMDDATAAQVRDLLTKGAAGGWIGLATDEPQALYDALVAKGVDITDAISPKPYGIDFGIRDPFGNRLRIGQVHAMAG